VEDLKVDDPRTLGRYKLLGRVGSGGMGIVYLGEDEHGGRVAVKLIRSELADDPAFRNRFRREVEAARRVGGICTAKVLDADLNAERPFLVTDYVEGGSLSDYVATRGPLTGDRLVGLAVGLAEAVVAIHAAGVIHRDLKPSNVLMAPEGPKVVDFGISHAADITAMTQSSVIIGSPAWMAPEQATGKPTTTAVDVFAWGATVAFASTGRSPFGVGKPDAVIYRLVHEEPDLDGVDDKLLPLVRAALSKDPAARPSADRLLVGVVQDAMPSVVSASGGESLATAVLDRTWQNQPPVVQPPPSTARKRRTVLIAAGATLIALAAAGTGIALALNTTPGHKAPSRSLSSSHPPTTSSSTTESTLATSPTTSSASSLESASVPLIVCPTTFAVSTQPTASSLPSSTTVDVSSDLVNQIAVYTDDGGAMKLVGPANWHCSASYGADGSGGVSIYPAGQSAPSAGPFTASSAEAVVGIETSACAGCREFQACPLFSSAASDLQRDENLTCRETPPPEETVDQLSAGVVAFQDPPGVAGDGSPSGGPYPANGVMTYYSGNDNGSWLDTCTLPANESQVCTVALNTFVDWYGTM